LIDESCANKKVKENKYTINANILDKRFIIRNLGLNNELDMLNLVQLTLYRHYLFIKLFDFCTAKIQDQAYHHK